jgi:putative chitinase
MIITLPQLKKILPDTKPATLVLHLPHLNAAMVEFEINTNTRAEQFIAQMAHESGGFKYMREIASGRAYEGRIALGNTYAGDGIKYKGRSPVQITGRKNYTLCGAALSLDCVAHPELLELPENGWRVAGWFWTKGAWRNLSNRAKTHIVNKYGGWEFTNLNRLADKMDFTGITLAINGGMTGYDDRHKYLVRAIAALEPELKI